MDAIVEEVCADEDIKLFEKVYSEQMANGQPSQKATFDYAWCLVRSRNKTHVKVGLHLLEDLFKNTADDTAKRDYLFYSAIACIRLGDYEKALKFIDAILRVQPQNHQAQELKQYTRKRMKKEGLIGMALVGGAAAVGIAGIGALIGLAVAKR